MRIASAIHSKTSGKHVEGTVDVTSRPIMVSDLPHVHAVSTERLPALRG